VRQLFTVVDVQKGPAVSNQEFSPETTEIQVGGSLQLETTTTMTMVMH
jgi:hypothetical protein